MAISHNISSLPFICLPLVKIQVNSSQVLVFDIPKQFAINKTLLLDIYDEANLLEPKFFHFGAGLYNSHESIVNYLRTKQLTKKCRLHDDCWPYSSIVLS